MKNKPKSNYFQVTTPETPSKSAIMLLLGLASYYQRLFLKFSLIKRKHFLTFSFIICFHLISFNIRMYNLGQVLQQKIVNISFMTHLFYIQPNLISFFNISIIIKRNTIGKDKKGSTSILNKLRQRLILST